MEDLIVVAIDGPSASGKGAVAKMLAKELNITYLDTGSMYRAISYLIVKNDIELSDLKRQEELIDNMNLVYKDEKIFLGDEDITLKIRQPQIDKIVGNVASNKFIREKLVNLQRKFADKQSVVMEGRDITSVVLKDTKYKFYLDADVNIRAQRRFNQLAKKNIETTFDEILADMKRRDAIDKNRETSPLKKVDDAFYIDVTNLSKQAVYEIMLKEIKNIKQKSD